MKPAPLWVYLNDHLAYAAKAERKAAYCLRNPPLPEHVDFLRALQRRLAEERAVLLSVMQVVNVPPQPLRVAVAWLEEGLWGLVYQRRRAQPRQAVLQQLEALAAHLHHRLSLWQTLEALSRTDHRLSSANLSRQQVQTRRQLRHLERLRLETGLWALAS